MNPRHAIGQHVILDHDDTPCPRVGQIIAVVRGGPERVIVCWSEDHRHDDTNPPACTIEALDQLQPRTPVGRP